jgi:glycosyltransferase involved in cell wall biosynthesis
MISILIPVYNTPIEYIEDCLESIDKQSFNEYEVIVVNDGSKDDISNFLNSIDSKKYKIYNKEKTGISDSLNYGIERCQYDIIARMDSDDVMLPKRLEIQLDYFLNNDVDVLGSQMEIFGRQEGFTNHEKIITKEILNKLSWFINHPTVMFKKNVIKTVGCYNPEFDGIEDFHLWCRVLYYGYKIENIDQVLLKHRKHEENTTRKNDKKIITERISSLKSYYFNIV